MLWLKVADTGIGMTPEEMARVIEPFQQADASITRKFGGSGLGLTICKELVTVMHGTLLYASAPHQGSIFIVALPSRLPEAHENEAPERPAAPADRPPTPAFAPFETAAEVGGGAVAGAGGEAAAVRDGRPRLTVLVTDDNPLNVRVLTRQLDRCGCDVVVQTNGLECVDYVRRMLSAATPEASEQGTGAAAAASPTSGRTYNLRNRRAIAASPPPPAVQPHEPPPAAVQRVDAILMDLHMPVMDGLAATRAIRQIAHPRAASIPIFAVSADDPADVGEACRQAGMTGFVRKPVVLSDLTALLSHVPPQ